MKQKLSVRDGFDTKIVVNDETNHNLNFEVGFFKNGELNGRGKKYSSSEGTQVLRDEFGKEIGKYSETSKQIILGYFKDGILDGIGCKIENDTILEVGIFDNGKRISDSVYQNKFKPCLINFQNSKAVYYGPLGENNSLDGFGIVQTDDGSTYYVRFSNNMNYGYVFLKKNDVYDYCYYFKEDEEELTEPLYDEEWLPNI